MAIEELVCTLEEIGLAVDELVRTVEAVLTMDKLVHSVEEVGWNDEEVVLEVTEAEELEM